MPSRKAGAQPLQRQPLRSRRLAAESKRIEGLKPGDSESAANLSDYDSLPSSQIEGPDGQNYDTKLKATAFEKFVASAD